MSESAEVTEKIPHPPRGVSALLALILVLIPGVASSEEPSRVRIEGPVEVKEPLLVRGEIRLEPMRIFQDRDGRVYLVPEASLQDAPAPLDRQQPLDRPGPLDRK